MKKVIQSKMEVVLIFNHVCWFWSFFPSEPLLTKELPCNNIAYCGLEAISNDTLYNNTKNQKVSLAYFKPFQHSKEKPVGGQNMPPPAWIGLIYLRN